MRHFLIFCVTAPLRRFQLKFSRHRINATATHFRGKIRAIKNCATEPYFSKILAHNLLTTGTANIRVPVPVLRLLSPISCLPTPVSQLQSPISCLLSHLLYLVSSPVSCLISCLLSHIPSLVSYSVSCLMSCLLSRLLPHVSYLKSPALRLLSLKFVITS